MARRGGAHRLLRWLWTSRRLDARLARVALLPAAGLWRAGTRAHELALARGWIAREEFPLPAIGVGNLTVGGSGRRAIALWAARELAGRGERPGLVLRGTAADAEAARHAAPGCIVIAAPELARGATLAASERATVLLLDGASGRGDLPLDLGIAVVSAETSRAVRWPVPAGPWRESPQALGRAHALVVTRKRAPLEIAEALAAELTRRFDGPVAVAHLGLRQLEGRVTGRRQPAALLAGRRVVAASASADPDAFIAQAKAAGAAVQVHSWRDGHEFRDEDVAWLAHAARRADHVVLTERDAARLRDRWPAAVPEPLVAITEPEWELGGEGIAAALAAAVTPVERL